MSFSLKDILASSRERTWREAGVSSDDIAVARLSGMDARDIGAFRSFTRRDLLIVVRCPKRDARIWHGAIPPKPAAASGSKSGGLGVGEWIHSDGRTSLYVSDYDLMSVWRHSPPTFTKIFTSAANGAKTGPWMPEARFVIHGLNQVLVSKIQHGCQDDFQSSKNPGLKGADHFMVFRLGMAMYIRSYPECARYYESQGLTPWPYNAAGEYIGPRLSGTE